MGVAIGGRREAPYTVAPWEFLYVARVREQAQNDPAFEGIRGDPRFPSTS